jgi:predicted Zn-dependent protease
MQANCKMRQGLGFGKIPPRQDICVPKRFLRIVSASFGRKQLLVYVLAAVVSALPLYAQKGPTPGGGTHGPTGRPPTAINYPPINTNPSPMAGGVILPDIPQLPKLSIADDEKCFPWKVSEVRAAAVSVSRLQVPSKARNEYEKACDASNKNKFEEAERHARGAIDKFQSYSAAWVMLGVILEEQNKSPEASDACSHAVSIDSTYLPGYLCEAEFGVRNQDWKQVLISANQALGLNSQGDAYAYYYRATAYLNLNNIAEAKKSAMQAFQVDATHSEPSIYFLRAQIYEREGDRANAIVELQQLLKRHLDRQQEDKARQFLAKLESEQSAK